MCSRVLSVLVIGMISASVKAGTPNVETARPTHGYYGILQAGNHHEISVSMSGAENTSVSYTVLRNDFILSSPDGAHWDNLVITPLIAVGDSGFPYTSYIVSLISGGGTPNGTGADTIRLSAEVPPGNCFTGMQWRTGFKYFKISFDSRLADAGDTIILSRPTVIDSSSWQWTEDILCGGTISAPPFIARKYPVSTKDCFFRGDIDGDGYSEDISDLTTLLAYLFVPVVSVNLPFPKQADLDADGSIDIADLTRMIDDMFITFEGPVPCP